MNALCPYCSRVQPCHTGVFFKDGEIVNVHMCNNCIVKDNGFARGGLVLTNLQALEKLKQRWQKEALDNPESVKAALNQTTSHEILN